MYASVMEQKVVRSATGHDKFFLVMAIILLLAVFIGFAPVYYLRSFQIVPFENIDAFSRYGEELPVHLLVHGIVLTGWFVLLVIQPLLIAGGRIHLHRSLGKVGAVIAIGVFATGVYTVFYRDAYMTDPMSRRAIGNLLTIFAFAICVAAAIYYRKHPAEHKRLMIIGSISILSPALDRFNVYPAVYSTAEIIFGWMPVPVQFVTPLLIIAILLTAVIVHDLRSTGRLYRSTKLGLAAIFFFAPLISVPLVLTNTWARLVIYFS